MDIEQWQGGENRSGGVRFALGTGAHGRLPIDDGEARRATDEIAQIAHDLRNPLSSIALETQLLDERLANGDLVDTTRALGRITQNVMFLDRLIHDLMDACTISNGLFALRRARHDLRTVVLQVIDRVVPPADRWRVQVDAVCGIEVMVDELRIERVIANLLDNALKYTPASASIIVRLSGDRDTAHVSICDAGPGLSSAEIGFVFEPYRRALSSAGQSGSGLGLYVSKQIVEAHGGYIGVDSARGAGARFYFSLPMS
jgi:signal transduction histidine kinase